MTNLEKTLNELALIKISMYSLNVKLLLLKEKINEYRNSKEGKRGNRKTGQNIEG